MFSLSEAGLPLPLATHTAAVVLPFVAMALITTVVAAAALAPRVARRLGSTRAVAALLIFGFGFVLTWTILPDADALEGIATDGGSCDTSRIGLIPWRELTTLNDHSLNVALFVPLGIAVGLLPWSRSAAVVVVAAFSLTFAVESIQLLVPVLGRGCETADLFDNTLGLVVGIGLGLVLRSLPWTARLAGSDASDS